MANSRSLTYLGRLAAYPYFHHEDSNFDLGGPLMRRGATSCPAAYLLLPVASRRVYVYILALRFLYRIMVTFSNTYAPLCDHEAVENSKLQAVDFNWHVDRAAS